MAFQPLVEDVLGAFPTERQRAFEGNDLAGSIRHKLPGELSALVDDPSYRVEGSPGAGNWAETPWVAIFDPLVTTSAQRGYYIVFLFRSDGAAVYLSLNQGATQVREESGRNYRDVLASRASAWSGIIPTELKNGLHAGPIDLAGRGWLTRGYQSGSVLDKYWTRGQVPNDAVMGQEVQRLLAVYRTLVTSLDVLADDADPSAQQEADVSPGEEGRRYRWHRRIERNPRLIRDAKRYHGESCKVCGFNFRDRYGEIGGGFIEAHHLTPLSEMGERPRMQDPKTDFTVVCSNCHRMLHRQTPPLTVGRLGSMLST